MPVSMRLRPHANRFLPLSHATKKVKSTNERCLNIEVRVGVRVRVSVRVRVRVGVRVRVRVGVRVSVRVGVSVRVSKSPRMSAACMLSSGLGSVRVRLSA